MAERDGGMGETLLSLMSMAVNLWYVWIYCLEFFSKGDQ